MLISSLEIPFGEIRITVDKS